MITADLDLELLHERYLVFRANILARASYVPSGPYAGTATVIRAEDSTESAEGWKALIERVREQSVVGDHYSIMLGDALPALAGIVARCLDGAS